MSNSIQNNGTFFQKLPHEAEHLALSYLQPQELSTVSQVDKHLNAVIWKPELNRHIPFENYRYLLCGYLAHHSLEISMPSIMAMHKMELRDLNGNTLGLPRNIKNYMKQESEKIFAPLRNLLFSKALQAYISCKEFTIQKAITLYKALQLPGFLEAQKLQSELAAKGMHQNNSNLLEFSRAASAQVNMVMQRARQMYQENLESIQREVAESKMNGSRNALLEEIRATKVAETQLNVQPEPSHAPVPRRAMPQNLQDAIHAGVELNSTAVTSNSLDIERVGEPSSSNTCAEVTKKILQVAIPILLSYAYWQYAQKA